MEDSYGNEEINLLRWSNSRQHRSPTIDTYFYPHEVRNLVKRQKMIEVSISFLLIVAYVLIMAGNGVSFYFFYEAQNHTNSNLWIFSDSCIINNGNYQCILVYALQFVAGLSAAILVLCSLVKSCCCKWYSKWMLCIDLFLLIVSLLFAVAASVFLNATLVSNSVDVKCDEDFSEPFCIAFITSWGVAGVVLIIIFLEVIIACLVKKCRRRMTYHRLE